MGSFKYKCLSIADIKAVIVAAEAGEKILLHWLVYFINMYNNIWYY